MASDQTVMADTMLLEKTGDLFSCDASDGLVHCVSEDLAMGKGIAVEFKKRFSSVTALKLQQKKVGEVATLKLTANQQRTFATQSKVPEPEGGFKDRHIFYMITKPKYFHKPTMDAFTRSLLALKEAALADNVGVLSMPRIGCGLDKLEWKVVKQLILDTFAGTGIVVNVYSL